MKILVTMLFVSSLLPSTFRSVNFDEIEKDVLVNEWHDYYLDDAINNTSYSSNSSNYENYMCSYFDNLTYNFGLNYKGSCGYVAMAMLLSYYDTFLSDSIVPEQYDVNSIGLESNMAQRKNSPGVLRDIIQDPSDSSNKKYALNMNAINYYSHISGLSNVSLHSKLINISGVLGYYDFSDNKYPCGTDFSIREDVLNYYLSDFLSFDNLYTFNKIDNSYLPHLSDDVRDFTINEIENGNPVLLSISSNSKGRHVVVAYDYNPNNDKIYCHFGWDSYRTHVTPESESFNIYLSALSINWNIKHSHTDNYGVYEINNNTVNIHFYCYEKPEIYTYNHTHDYDYSYTWLNLNQHRSVCGCDISNVQYHVVDSGSISSGHKYAKCIYCGGNASVGLTQNGVLNKKISYSKNGSYVLSNGVIVLKKEDLLLFECGKLLFYENSNLIINDI